MQAHWLHLPWHTFPAAPSASACSFSAPPAEPAGGTGTAAAKRGADRRPEKPASEAVVPEGGIERQPRLLVSARSATPLGCDPPSGHCCPGQYARATRQTAPPPNLQHHPGGLKASGGPGLTEGAGGEHSSTGDAFLSYRPMVYPHAEWVSWERV